MTRPDTLGPYFPPHFAPGNALELFRPGEGRPHDGIIALAIKILDRDGNGATNMLVEAWQSNAAAPETGRHPNSKSFARVLSRDGNITLTMVRPLGTDGRAGWVALWLFSDGLEQLLTYTFLPDDPSLDVDPLLRAVGAERAGALIARRTGDSSYAIDIQLSAGRETPFFTFGETAATLTPYPGDNTSLERTPLQALVPLPETSAAALLPYIDDMDLPETKGASLELAASSASSPQLSRGRSIELVGRVIDASGELCPDVLVELWAANAVGRYRHPDDRTDPPLDPDYDGTGRLRTDADGRYCFHLIMPGAYLARPDIGRWRPGHLHFSLLGLGIRLVTQLYFPGDPHHDRDPMRLAHGDAFGRQLVTPVPADADRFTFDFVIRRERRPSLQRTV